MTVDYGAWQAIAKAQAVEQRVDAMMATASQGWVRCGVGAGWVNYGGRELTCRYTSDGRGVWITGELIPGTTADNTAIAWVGGGYIPGRVEPLPCGQWGTTHTGYPSPFVEIDPTGNIYLQSFSGTGGRLVIGGVYPLDAY